MIEIDFATKERELRGTASPKDRFLSVLQNNVKLRGSVVHYELRNLSKWYHNRKVLGAKFHSARLVNAVKGRKVFKAAIYECRTRRTTTASQPKLVPCRRELGIFDSYYLAHGACDRAIAARDYGGDESGVEASHFLLLIVSDAFENLTHTERLELVFEALLDEFSVKREMYEGHKSGRFNDFHPLQNMKVKLLLELHATNKWNANLHIASGHTSIPLEQSLLHPLTRASHELGTDILRDIINHKRKLSTPSSQFILCPPFYNMRGDEKFHRMPSCRNHAIANKNNEWITNSHASSSVKHRGRTIVRTKLTRSEKEPRCMAVISNDLEEEEIFAKHEYLLTQISSCAIRMQRMYRLKLLPRIELRWWRKLQLSLMIQRNTRGHLARKQMRLCRSLVTWAKHNGQQAVVLQKAARRLLSYVALTRMQKKRFICCINASATIIQTAARQYIARGICRIRFQSFFFQYKTLPSVIVVQARWRRIKSQWCIDDRRNQVYSAMLIQLHIRGMLCRRWLLGMKYKTYCDNCARRIQTIFRVAVCRTILHQLIEVCYVKCIIIPSLIRIQSQCRIYRCRNHLRLKRNLLMAAIIIQRNCRTLLSILAVEAMKNESARQIQTFYRRISQRQAYLVQWLARQAIRLYASRCISSFWLTYRRNIQVRSTKECAAIKAHSVLLAQLLKDQIEVQNELKTNLHDQGLQEMFFKLLRIRRHVIKGELEVAYKRIGEVERELDEMQLVRRSSEGKEKHTDTSQWIEVFTNEVLETRNQIEMGFEELHGCLVHMDLCEVNLKQLERSREILEHKLDDLHMQEINVRSWIHRMFLRLSVRKANYEEKRKIRFEVEKWALKDFSSN